MASHVSQCMEKACMCDTWKACVWHMACHVSSCMTLLNPISRGFKLSLWQSSTSVRGSSKEKEEEWRKGEEKGRKERRKGGKEKKRKEEKEERERKEEKEGVSHTEQTRTVKNP